MSIQFRRKLLEKPRIIILLQDDNVAVKTFVALEQLIQITLAF